MIDELAEQMKSTSKEQSLQNDSNSKSYSKLQRKIDMLEK